MSSIWSKLSKERFRLGAVLTQGPAAALCVFRGDVLTYDVASLLGAAQSTTARMVRNWVAALEQRSPRA